MDDNTIVVGELGTLVDATDIMPTTGLVANAANNYVLSYTYTSATSGRIQLDADPAVNAHDTSDALQIDHIFVSTAAQVTGNWKISGLGLGRLLSMFLMQSQSERYQRDLNASERCF